MTDTDIRNNLRSLGWIREDFSVFNWIDPRSTNKYPPLIFIHNKRWAFMGAGELYREKCFKCLTEIFEMPKQKKVLI